MMLSPFFFSPHCSGKLIDMISGQGRNYILLHVTNKLKSVLVIWSVSRYVIINSTPPFSLTGFSHLVISCLHQMWRRLSASCMGVLGQQRFSHWGELRQPRGLWTLHHPYVWAPCSRITEAMWWYRAHTSMHSAMHLRVQQVLRRRQTVWWVATHGQVKGYLIESDWT